MRYCMIGKSKCVPCFFSKPKPMRNLEFLHNFGVRRSPLSKQCFRVELSPKTLRREPSKSRPLQSIGFISRANSSLPRCSGHLQAHRVTSRCEHHIESSGSRNGVGNCWRAYARASSQCPTSGIHSTNPARGSPS